MRWGPLAAILLALAAPAAAQAPLPWSEEEVKAIGRHGPWPPPLPRDPSNRIAGTSAGGVLRE